LLDFLLKTFEWKDFLPNQFKSFFIQWFHYYCWILFKKNYINIILQMKTWNVEAKKICTYFSTFVNHFGLVYFLYFLPIDKSKIMTEFFFPLNINNE
jgi:hypothetical protein